MDSSKRGKRKRLPCLVEEGEDESASASKFGVSLQNEKRGTTDEHTTLTLLHAKVEALQTQIEIDWTQRRDVGKHEHEAR